MHGKKIKDCSLYALWAIKKIESDYLPLLAQDVYFITEDISNG